MSEPSPPPPKRSRISSGDVSSLNKEELIKKYQKQQDYVEELEAKLGSAASDDNEDKDKATTSETTRRENILVMRLANKEQEVQEYIAQINHIKKAQEDAALMSLRQANLDPGVNLLFGKMREELQQTKDKLEQAQSELSAWKFTPDSQNGKKLISRCRTLIAENQELGRQLSQGKTAQLEAELALQKKYSEEMKASQDELNEFVIQLDEEVEGMQSTIQVLQQQLSVSKREIEDYKTVIKKYESDSRIKQENDFKFTSRKTKLQKNYKPSKPLNCSRSVTDDANDFSVEEDVAMSPSDSADFQSRKLTRTSGEVRIDNAGSDTEGNGDGNDEYCLDLETASSSGTPITENVRDDHVTATDRTPETPLHDQLDYGDDGSDSWSKERASDCWDDRTKVRYSGSDSEEEAKLVQEEIASADSDTPCDDTDDIKAHISSVSPSAGFETASACKSLTSNTNNSNENHTKSKFSTSDSNADNARKNTAAHGSRHNSSTAGRSLRAKESTYRVSDPTVKSASLKSADAMRTQEAVNTTLSKAGGAGEPDHAALMAYYKNVTAQAKAGPNDDSLNSSTGQSNPDARTSTNEVLVTKTCGTTFLNNHGVEIIPQNGVDEDKLA